MWSLEKLLLTPLICFNVITHELTLWPTDECATKRVFGYQTLLFITVTGELLTCFFPITYQDQFVFLLQASTIFSLVIDLFWRLFTGVYSLLPRHYSAFKGLE